eukprot:997139-Rhodomonas_salina.1
MAFRFADCSSQATPPPGGGCFQMACSHCHVFIADGSHCVSVVHPCPPSPEAHVSSHNEGPTICDTLACRSTTHPTMASKTMHWQTGIGGCDTQLHSCQLALLLAAV